MELTCHQCGFTGDHLEYNYLCKNGCPACGESDLRQCPNCGAECVFSRAESLEDEEMKMHEYSRRLAVITKTDNPAILEEAKMLITALREMNMRWNIPQLHQFLIERQKELFS